MGKSGKKLNIGSYNTSVDEKGRLMIPKAFRTFLEKEIVISLEFENTLVLRPQNEFEKWSGLLLSMSYLNREARILQRKILGNSMYITIDLKGRILIPKSLLEQAKMKKTVQVIGTGNKIEIIASEAWEELMSEDKISIEEAAEKISENKKNKD
ncbi:MAG: transcriptional regulator MraZ [Candidatus Hepatoplasma vulgare]|nr:MAG: transcriptional regulator MraZ [Candidatus Hepatoplasma sp.]